MASFFAAASAGCAAAVNVAPSNSANSPNAAAQTAPEQTAEAEASPDAPSAAADAIGIFGASPADDRLRQSQKDADLMLYESWPDETSLGNDHIANVVPVWIEAIDGAQRTLDFEEFYAIGADAALPETAATQALAKVVEALKNAADRGVKIRFIVDKKMSSGENAELPQALRALPGAEVRVIDFGQIAGGVQHAKFFIADGERVYFGSQNFDWRSLTQISEMGARIRNKTLAAPIADIFGLDWQLAQDPKSPIAKTKCYGATRIEYMGETMTAETVASPKSALPCDDMWDLPKIIGMIARAKHSVSFQLLNYATVNYDKTSFDELDKALTDAAKRGVKVRMLVSDWSTRPKYMKDLKRLAKVPNFEARMIEIPEHSMGFVPYSRTIHSKFLVADDDKTWLGTSNWSGDYFYNSRNIGIIATGKALNRDLTKSFDRYWNSAYAVAVDPDADYPVKDQTKPKSQE